MEIKITTKKANCEQEVNITCSAAELVIISQQPAFKEFTDLLLDHAKWESAFQRKRMSSRLDSLLSAQPKQEVGTNSTMDELDKRLDALLAERNSKF